MIAALLALAIAVPSTDTLVVGAAGQYATIGAAASAARAGDVVIVTHGVYREPTIVVDRRIEITGEEGAVIDGDHARRGLILIAADSVIIRGLVLRNIATNHVDDVAAIRIEGVDDCVVEGNRIENAYYGIYIAASTGCRIEHNRIRGEKLNQTASGNGIHAWNANRLVIRENAVSGHRDGIYFEFVRDSRVEGNRSEGNLRYGLHFMFSDRCEYTGNVFRENHAGVAVMYTKQVTMEANTFEDNRGTATYGLLLKEISDGRISGNRWVRNTVGIMADGMNRTRVEWNTFSGNGWAIRLMASSADNTFTRNEFIGNAFDVSTNSRQAFSTFEENWWDRYDGYDLDRDGYGDVPFRPVRLFSLLVERNAPSLVLLRSLFVTMLDMAERVAPLLTPAALADERPLMKRDAL